MKEAILFMRQWQVIDTKTTCFAMVMVGDAFKITITLVNKLILSKLE